MKRLRRLGWILVAGITLEASARIEDWIKYDAPLLDSYSVEALYTYDNTGRLGRPYGRYQKWRLNSLGYRGPEISPSKLSIVCIGASETFGMYESEGREYPRQLEALLNSDRHGSQYQVVNLSYFGLTLPTATRLLPALLSRVHPKIALIYPSPGGYINRAIVVPPAERPDSQHFDFRIVDKVNELGKRVLPLYVQTELREIGIALEVRRKGPVRDRVPKQNLDIFRQDLERITADLRKENVEPVLITHANRFGTPVSADDRPFLVAWRKFYPLLREEGFLDLEERANAVIRDFGAEHHIVVIDAARQLPKGSRYFGDFSHFTDMGAQIMAKVIARDLASHLLVDRVATNTTATESAKSLCAKTGY